MRKIHENLFVSKKIVVYLKKTKILQFGAKKLKIA